MPYRYRYRMLTYVAGRTGRQPPAAQNGPVDLAISINSKIEVLSVRAGCLIIAFFWRMGKVGFQTAGNFLPNENSPLQIFGKESSFVSKSLPRQTSSSHRSMFMALAIAFTIQPKPRRRFLGREFSLDFFVSGQYTISEKLSLGDTGPQKNCRTPIWQCRTSLYQSSRTRRINLKIESRRHHYYCFACSFDQSHSPSYLLYCYIDSSSFCAK
jgi:hypothetical protein